MAEGARPRHLHRIVAALAQELGEAVHHREQDAGAADEQDAGQDVLTVAWLVGQRRWASLSARHTRSGVAGMSIASTPAGLSASRIAAMIVCGAAMQPACPEPLTPSGLARVGRSISSMSKYGKSSARGRA